MTKLTRLTGKVFGETADGTLADPQIGQFGSAKAGTYVGTGDVATIQSLPAWSNGWIDAVAPSQQYPALPEMTGVHKVLSHQSAYILQEGVPEWDNETTYYTDSLCKYTSDNKTIIYKSTIDENTGNLPPSLNGWEIYYSPSTVQSNYIPFCVNSGEISDNITIPSYNYTPVGAVINTDGVLSGFSSSNYVTYPNNITLGTSNFELVFKVKPESTGQTIPFAQTGFQFNTGLLITASTIYFRARNNSGNAFAFSVSPSASLSTTSFTYIKITRSGNNFDISIKNENDNSYSSISTFISSASIQSVTNLGGFYDTAIGWQTGNGEIDLNGSYIEIDGAMFWQGVSNNPAGGDPSCLKLPEGSTTVITRNFIQPILTANGTLGGSDFAVASSYYRDYPSFHSGEAYYLFDNAQYTNLSFNGGSFPCSVTIYNPNPLNITQLVFKSWTEGTGNDQWKNGYIYGSNDNSTWTELTSYTNNNGSKGYLFTIDLSSNTNYYTYYKITVTSSNNQTMCENIDITATEQVTITSSENVIFDGSTVPVVYTNAYSTTNKFTEQQNLDVSTFADGTYNIFASITDATLTGYANTIYRQSAAPSSPSANDVWLNTSVRPLSAWIYDGTAWQEFTGVPIGSCEVTSGAATDVHTFPYNYTEKFLVSDACMPSSRSETLTLGASGASYTAPANGYFFLYKESGSANQYITMTNDSSAAMSIHQWVPQSGSGCCGFLPAKKGDTVTITYTATGNTIAFKYIYAEGAKEEA